MRRFDSYLFGPVSLARPYLLAKAILLLIAFDCWRLMPGQGAWYGAGGFNVAHFAWLDRLGPLPSPGLYIGTVLLAGLIALTMVFGRLWRAGIAAVLVLYTYAWAMGMVDSFQHHYLISLLLVSMVFFPLKQGRDLFDDVETSPEPAPRGSALGYVSACVTASIVYFYTAVTKLDPDWRQGHALANLSQNSTATRELLAAYVERGGEAQAFWQWMAIGAISVQFVTGVGYLLAARRDSLTRRWSAFGVTLLLVAPLSFHLGAELLELKIGSFSYYMIAFSIIAFSPSWWLETIARGLSFPSRVFRAFWEEASEGEASAKNERLMRTFVNGLVVLGLVCVGAMVDLPGAAPALGALGLVLLAFSGRRGARGTPELALVSSVLLLALLSAGTVRFDFYRWRGGDLRRRSIPCQTEESYARCVDSFAAYERANRYAPEGEDREAKEAEMRQFVEAGRGRFGGAGVAIE